MFLHPLCPVQKQIDTLIDGIGFVHNPECPTNHQDEYDDGGGAFESLEEGGENLPGLGLVLHMMVRIAHHHVAFMAVHHDSLAVKLAAGNNPRQDSAHHDDREHNRKGVRDVEFAFCHTGIISKKNQQE